MSTTGARRGGPEVARGTVPVSARVAEAVRLFVPPAAWVALWGALNAGGLSPRHLIAPGSHLEWLHAIRALLPLGVLVLWVLHCCARPRLDVRRASRAESLWLGYGLVGLVAGLAGPHPTGALYWGFCFLAPFAAAEMYLWGGGRVAKARRLNHLTWLCAGFALVALMLLAGGEMFVGSGLDVSAYNLVVRIGEVLGMPMVRSTGLSRMAAVVALVGYVSAVRASGRGAVGWTLLALGAAATVVVMGSEGSVVSFAGAALLVTGCLVSLRWLVLLGLSAGLFLIVGPDSAAQAVSSWFPDFGALATLQDRAWSGRPGNWRAAWEAIRSSVALGSGFQADRYLTGLNAQNGFLYSLLTGGFVGGALYVGGLVLLWRRIWKALRRRAALSRPLQRTLLQVVGVAAFLTLRHVPENTSALFSVDLLLLVPAMVFASELARSEDAG